MKLFLASLFVVSLILAISSVANADPGNINGKDNSGRSVAIPGPDKPYRSPNSVPKDGGDNSKMELELCRGDLRLWKALNAADALIQTMSGGDEKLLAAYKEALK